MKYLSSRLKNYSEKEKRLIRAFTRIIGKRPYNIALYDLAMKHSSIALTHRHGFKESNERLEYLGDAVLGIVVAEYLFKRFPFKDEGFLTEIRSRIVNRESLNQLAVKIGLSELVDFEGKRKTPLSHKSIYGDAMEAFIGALYLDRGFEFSRRYIIRKLIMQHYDLREIIDTTANFKSLIIEWAQKSNRTVSFESVKATSKKQNRQFRVKLLVDGKEEAIGIGFSKKKAEQDAARKAAENLNINE